MDEDKAGEAVSRLIMAAAKLEMKAVRNPETNEVRVFVDPEAAAELNGALLDLQSLLPDLFHPPAQEATDPGAFGRFMMLEPIDA